MNQSIKSSARMYFSLSSLLFAILFSFSLPAFSASAISSSDIKKGSQKMSNDESSKNSKQSTNTQTAPTKESSSEQHLEVAILAGGCFWGVEELLRSYKGVIKTEVGYTGGLVENPNYNLVKTGASQHAEAVWIQFDNRKLSYEELLLYFFKLHDPTTENRQGNDIGTQYRSAIFYLSEKQKETAQKVIERVNRSHAWNKPVVTKLEKAGKFYPAEEYHQKYLVKNPGGYTCHFVRKIEF